MPGELFYWVFNMSIVASVAGLPLLFIRRVRFIPHRVSVFLWLVPFIRMCVPFGLNNPYSIMTLISRLTTKTVTVYESGDLAFSVTNVMMAANSYFPITYKVNLLEKVFDTSAFIWIIGAVAIIIAMTVLYVTTLRETSGMRLTEGNVFLSDKVTSPAVYGIIKPKIVLPASDEGKDNKYVLRHEMTHIRRCDNLWRLLGLSAPRYIGSTRCHGYF